MTTSTSAACLRADHGRCFDDGCACTLCGHGGRPVMLVKTSAPKERASRAEYQRRHRAENQAAAKQNQIASNAREKALRRLGQRHPAELAQLQNEERAAVGLPPVGESLGRPRGSA
jgi:hypothetical protein